jgi:hypothetical protein
VHEKVGGLIGKNIAGVVKKSSSNSIVKGNYIVGGFIGENGGKVSTSYSMGEVSGNNYIGGFIGKCGVNISNTKEYFSIINCFNRATVHGGTFVGGFCGDITYRGGSLIQYCYSSAIVEGEKSFHNFHYGKSEYITGCFYENATNDSARLYDRVKGLPKDSITKKFLENYGWNFYSVWDIDSEINDGYPYLNDRTIQIEAIKPVDENENGFTDIYCFENLLWMYENPDSLNSKYELINDINCGILKYADDSINLGGILFKGIFEGNNYKIDSLIINQPINDGIGLFKEIYGEESEIRNLTISNSKFIGFESVGAIAGIVYDAQLYNCLIENCFIEGRKNIGGLAGSIYKSKLHNNQMVNNNIIGIENIGGIVGSTENSIILNCHLDNYILGSKNVGGTIGKSLNCLISNISSNFDLHIRSGIPSIKNFGGLAGELSGSYLADCFAKGNIHISQHIDYIGGLVGRNQESYIKNCYTAFSYKTSDNIPGQIFGYSSIKGLTESTFWDTEISGILQNAQDESMGLTTQQMKQKQIFIAAGWNFEKTWDINSELNDGYPFLKNKEITFPNPVEPWDYDNDGFYDISSYENLLWFSQDTTYWDKNIELTNDLKPMNVEDYGYWLKIDPIGNREKPFSGKFNGNGYSIDSLMILANQYNDSGLFGNTSGKNSEITHLGVKNAIINGYKNTGGIVGRAIFKEL